jgi:hypothetical protein
MRRPWRTRQALIWTLDTNAPARIYWTFTTGQALIGMFFANAVTRIDGAFTGREALIGAAGPAGAKPTCYMNEWHSISPC